MPKDGTLTKDLLADTLVGMVASSQEVTVKALVAKAGVNRQTFYYHFETIDDLVAYTCNTKARAAFSKVVAESGGRGGFRTLVGLAEENRPFACYLLSSKGRAWLRSSFYEESVSLTRGMVDRLLGEAPGVSEGDRDSVAAYCTIATASILEMWVTGGLAESVDEITRMLETGVRNATCGLLVG